MSFLSRLASFFGRPAEAPRLIVDGHALWWRSDARPLNVWLDGSDLSLAALAVHGFPGGSLMFPTALENETRNAFFGSRETFRNAVVIQPYTLTSSPGAFRCTTDVRYDKATGEARNALIEWTIFPGDLIGNVRRLQHELGHCLGLGHCDGTVMQASVDNWRLLGFSNAQLDYLKGLRR